MTTATALYWVRPSPKARARFAAIIDTWERNGPHLRGGFGTLEERLCAAWVREGRALIPIDDYQTYQQVKGYAAYESAGTWQDIFREFADQMPDNVPDPQGKLFS